MFFWNSSHIEMADMFVLINAFSHLVYLATRLNQMRTNSTPSILTHIMVKTFAGIGALNILHNTSAAYFVQGPHWHRFRRHGGGERLDFWRLFGVRPGRTVCRSDWKLEHAARLCGGDCCCCGLENWLL